MDIIIKKFSELTNTELYKILKLRTDIFVVEQNCPYPELDNKDYDSYHLFYNYNSEPVSYARIIPKNISFNEISLGRVCTKKDFRREKLSYNLLKEAINFSEIYLKETRIRISAQFYLLKFYNLLGFVQVSEVYKEDGIDHIEMYYEK
ncbi:MAG TPA: GNAT family N-acetyltransferase [Tepiditoga sp.]|nr:GNAT family N-acetyltransferase [Tepiditoga sp.]